MKNNDLQTVQVPIKDLTKADYNPRKWDEKALNDLKTSIKKFGLVDPIIINSAKNRKNVVIGGHMRIEAAKALGIATIPAVQLNIPDIEKEKELNLRLNKNQGEFDYELLATFTEEMLEDIGFDSEELDAIFDWEDENPELFDLKKELEKLDIKEVKIQKGDVYQLGDHRLMCGDSTIQKDIQKLMNGEKADMCLCDPPYLLDYLHGKKKHGKATEGFGYKRDRKYLETDVLPDDFTELWMKNVSEVAKEDFHIIVYENWKNIPVIFSEMKKYWKVKNMIVWHIPNRHQGFAAKYKFFSKHDIAMVGTSLGQEGLNTQPEAELLEKLQNFHKDKNSNLTSLKKLENDLKPLNPDDAGEVYIISQLNVSRAIPEVLDQHINLLEEGEDLDRVLVSFEYNVYRVKKDVYSDMGDWELLLKVLPDDRRFQIQKDPKGPGDLILKELIWIKDYEKGLKDMGFERI